MPRVKIGKLDGSAEEGVIQKLQIRGYPTILFMQFNGKRITTYNGKLLENCTPKLDVLYLKKGLVVKGLMDYVLYQTKNVVAQTKILYLK